MSDPQLVPDGARQAAYRRLALTILALDVPTLTAELRAQRQPPTRLSNARPTPARRAA